MKENVTVPGGTAGGPLPDGAAVLVVDDDPQFVELTATFLEREDGEFDVTTATSAAEGLDRLAERKIDCVVSDYEMPGMDGLEFLGAVRETHSTLPFILFTGKGSEEIASRAISAGVTDYLQKKPGSEQFELLANQIQNAVERVHAQREIEEHKTKMEALHAVTTDLVSCRSKEMVYELTVDAAESILDLYLCYVGIVEDDSIVPRERSAHAGPQYVRTMATDEGIAGKTFQTGPPI